MRRSVRLSPSDPWSTRARGVGDRSRDSRDHLSATALAPTRRGRESIWRGKRPASGRWEGVADVFGCPASAPKSFLTRSSAVLGRRLTNGRSSRGLGRDADQHRESRPMDSADRPRPSPADQRPMFAGILCALAPAVNQIRAWRLQTLILRPSPEVATAETWTLRGVLPWMDGLANSSSGVRFDAPIGVYRRRPRGRTIVAELAANRWDSPRWSNLSRSVAKSSLGRHGRGAGWSGAKQAYPEMMSRRRPPFRSSCCVQFGPGRQEIVRLK
jgi:hypothetical protein